MGSSQFLYKPVSDSNGNPVVLLPTQYSGQQHVVQIRSANGDVLSTGRYDGVHNQDRPHYRFDRPGSSYGEGAYLTVLDSSGNELFNQSISPTTRYEGSFDGLNAVGGPQSGGGLVSSPGGGNFAPNLSFVDFSSIQAPSVNFGQRFDEASNLAVENRGTFYNEITGNDARDAALGLVDTDIQGINAGLNNFIPRVRQEGEQDLSTNISRSGTIDNTNLERLPRFNAYNREEVARNNEFTQSQQDAAVDSTGLGFRERMSTLISNLETRANGELQEPLDSNLTRYLRNTGSELSLGTGISTQSGAGVRASDRLTIKERLNLALEAESRLPSVLSGAQSYLQAPIERPQTLYAQPTNIPLNVSNIADRIPLTSSVSAGSAQLSIGSAATEIGTIPATTYLSGSLAADQYNATGKFERDKFVYSATQDQLTAQDAQTQGLINADKADAIRAEQAAATQAGLNIRENSQQLAGYGGLAAGIQALGSFLGGSNAGTIGGNSSTGAGSAGSGIAGVASGIVNGVGSVVDTVASGAGAVLDAGSAAADYLFGDGDGVVSVGGFEISSQGFSDFLTSASNFMNGGSVTPVIAAPQSIEGSPVIEATPNKDGSVTYTAEDGNTETVKPQREGIAGSIEQFMTPFANTGLDARIVSSTAAAVANWGNLNAGQQASSAGSVTTSILENRGVLSSEQARDIRGTSNALGTIMNPNASDSEKAAAIARAGVGIATTSFTGTIDAPTSIGGQMVTGSTVMDDGSPGFQLQDGSSVSQSTVLNSANSQLALQALSVLSSKAPTEQKLQALSAVGVTGAAANNLISQTAAGNSLAGLALFNTATNWDKMNPVQQAAATLQTGSAVLKAASQVAGQSVGTSTTASAGNSALAYTSSQSASTIGTSSAQSASATAANSGLATTANVLTGAAAALGVGLGIDQAADVISAVDDMPQSQAVKSGAIGGAASGAAIGGGAAVLGAMASGAAVGSYVPVVGTIVGAAVGALVGVAIGNTGTGKNTGQIMRDSWRGGMEESGLAEKINGSHHVTLADGSKYDIGRDGGTTLQNVGENIDGRDVRHTYDVDWSNQVAVDSIPDAHLFALATGLDPTGGAGHDLFNRATAQALNAATSNASSKEEAAANIKAMMRDIDPRHLAMRVETLKAQELLTDQEASVYLNRINKMYGTQLLPTDKGKLTNSLIKKIRAIPEGKRTDSDKELLKTLTNPKKLAENRQSLSSRLDRDSKNSSTGDKKKATKKPAEKSKVITEDVDPFHIAGSLQSISGSSIFRGSQNV